MKHEHKPKFVNIKRFQSNNYLNLPQEDGEVTVITKHNNPKYVVMTVSAFNMVSNGDGVGGGGLSNAAGFIQKAVSSNNKKKDHIK